jgi:hypothetical protein
MAKFDLDTFAELQGQGRGPVASLGTAFGMPQCLLNLGEDVLSILPGGVLNGLNQVTASAREKANEVTRDAFRALLLDSGIIEFDTESGTFKFVSDSSKFGLDQDEGSLLNTLNGLIGAAGAAAAFGGQLYQNYQTVSAQIDGILGCVDSFKTTLEYQGGNAAEKRRELANTDPDAYNRLIQSKYDSEKARIQSSVDFIEQAEDLQAKIQDIQRKRALDPSLEPKLIPDLAQYASGTLTVFEPDETPETDPIRLVFGPPKSTEGKFLLSVDGLYYNSKGASGIEPVLVSINQKKQNLVRADQWMLEFAPNLGGKGDQISLRTFNQYLDTIFDPDTVDESPDLATLYDKDNFLQMLIGQKEKRVLDIRKNIAEAEAEGESEAVINNYKQTLISESAYHEDKIIRRKKQIEVAFKAPSLFGVESTVTPAPINDFSYLQGINLPVDEVRQKKLLIDNADVEDIVLPIETTLVRPLNTQVSNFAEFLLVPEVGVGGIIYDGSSSQSSSGLELAANEVVTTGGLFAIYNYLDSRIVSPSSVDFHSNNSAAEEKYNNCQVAGRSASSVFVSGLSIPYLQGIVSFGTDATDPTGAGSYVKLPNTAEFQNLTYNPDGFTFETWIHVPNLNDTSAGWYDGSAVGLYRTILSCENFGVSTKVSRTLTDQNNIYHNNGTDYSRGLYIGLTRDRRFTQSLSPSSADDANNPRDYLSLIVAPTQSINASAAGFIRSFPEECNTTTTWKAANIPFYSTLNGKRLESMGAEFCCLTFSFDFRKNILKTYFDGALVQTDSISEVFGTSPGLPISVPNFKQGNAFEYKANTVGDLAPNSIKTGPKLYPYFTPWILGGGYTDGAADLGNFMGGTNYGTTSGLRGHLGSTKFYSRALDADDILYNFEYQKKIFKNISTGNSYFAPTT